MAVGDPTTVPSSVKAQLAQDGKAERAKMRAALKRRKAQLLRQMADCEERSAEIDEKLAALLRSDQEDDHGE